MTSEPLWQPTMELRWKETEYDDARGPLVENLRHGGPMILEQLWTRAEWTDELHVPPLFYSAERDWRAVEVAE